MACPASLILLTGEKGAGKDTLAKYLAGRHGFVEIRIRDLVYEEAQRRGIADPAIRDLQDVGDLVRKETGDNGAWVSRVYDRARERGVQRLVINGIRNPAEIAAGRARDPQALLIGVVAEKEIRWKRFQGRMIDGREITREYFETMDRRDHGEGQPPEGQRVGDCLALVEPEHLFRNEGGLEALHGWADARVAALHLSAPSG